MRIERIRLDAFGRLRDLDTGPEPLGDLIVVLGPNEAGKSTLFTFLTTVLYGFHPASRERNPHVPWGATEASGSVDFRLEGQGCVRVERRLRAAPTGRLSHEGRTEDLRNQPLPWVSHVPRSVFRQVFAVTLSDLAGLDDGTWGRIQDRIVGSMGSTDLLSARSVAERLEQEASEIWRPNRRGNQRLRVLQEEMRGIRARRAAALDRDREVRSLIQTRDGLQERLRSFKAERQEHRVAVERVSTLLPIKRRLERIGSLRAKGGHAGDLTGLPEDPVHELERVEREHDALEGRLASLEEQVLEPEARMARFNDGMRRLLADGDAIRRFIVTATETAPSRRKIPELERQLANAQARLVDEGADLFEEGWKEDVAPALERLSVSLLADRVERLEQTSASTNDASDSRAPLPTVVALLLGVIGVALLVWGFLGGPVITLPLGAALATAGIFGTALPLRKRGVAPSPSPGEAIKAEIARLLQDLPIASTLLASPSTSVVGSLSRLQATANEREELRRECASASERVAAVDARALTLASKLQRNGDWDAESFAPSLERDVRDAERAKDAAEGAEREVQRLTRERESTLQHLKKSGLRFGELRTNLGRLGRGDIDRGAEESRERLRAHRRADELEEELAASHPDLDAMVTRIAELDGGNAPWALDDRDLARRKAHIENLDAQIEQLIAKSQTLERDAVHMREAETVDAVDSELAALLEEEARLVRERDRKWVLAQLVREADRRFREEHQPDLVRRAGDHLARLTAGRYDRLLVDDSRPDSLFHLMGRGLPAPVALAPPVSTGTLEQAYLSLRFAIVDHLDMGRESLPLFIDEVFVNWDRERRSRGLAVLGEIARTRQLFVFTCHDAVANELASHGARTLHLHNDP